MGLKRNKTKVYRLLVYISKRQPGGHEYNFECDISGLSTARDLKSHTLMATVERTNHIRYYEESPDLRQEFCTSIRTLRHLPDAFSL